MKRNPNVSTQCSYNQGYICKQPVYSATAKPHNISTCHPMLTLCHRLGATCRSTLASHSMVRELPIYDHTRTPASPPLCIQPNASGITLININKYNYDFIYILKKMLNVYYMDISWKTIQTYFRDNPEFMVKHHLQSYNLFFLINCLKFSKKIIPFV